MFIGELKIHSFIHSIVKVQ